MTLIMKPKASTFIMVCFTLLAVFSSCEKDSYDETIITMTTESDSVAIRIAGSGKFNISWGDSTEIETHTLRSNYTLFYRNYSDTSARKIIITGGKITHLNCSSNQLTSLDLSGNTMLAYLYCVNNKLTVLDVSKNPDLTYLHCSSNQLTNLDVSANTALKELRCGWNQLRSIDVSNNMVLGNLDCRNNELDAAALNALFETLHNNTKSKAIDIRGNSGIDDCDRSIAISKGWTVL